MPKKKLSLSLKERVLLHLTNNSETTVDGLKKALRAPNRDYLNTVCKELHRKGKLARKLAKSQGRGHPGFVYYIAEKLNKLESEKIETDVIEPEIVEQHPESETQSITLATISGIFATMQLLGIKSIAIDGDELVIAEAK